MRDIGKIRALVRLVGDPQRFPHGGHGLKAFFGTNRQGLVDHPQQGARIQPGSGFDGRLYRIA
ncbi:MAG: hypothetical protein MZW92_47620 [Comamonadaceae bacterium]|nr:hypothetical protein [Comamonadaceae bacterium]